MAAALQNGSYEGNGGMGSENKTMFVYNYINTCIPVVLWDFFPVVND